MRILVVGLSRFSAPSGLCRYSDMLCRVVSDISGAEASLAVGSWQQTYFQDVFKTADHSKLIVADVRNDYCPGMPGTQQNFLNLFAANESMSFILPIQFHS